MRCTEFLIGQSGRNFPDQLILSLAEKNWIGSKIEYADIVKPGMAPAFQAGFREFESHYPHLKVINEIHSALPRRQ